MFTQNNMGMNMGMNYQNIDQVNIFDCFNYYQKQNEMEGYCENVEQIMQKFYQFPKFFHLLVI